ncbi:MAG: Ig-like domain-containing protein, partial [Spirochaetaceae bacterium]|nr:Ig-like domain-containing protein [Spirochaetaceae bacterium]
MKKVKKMGKNNSLNTAKRGLAPALLALVLSAAIFAGCDDVTKDMGEVSQAPARSAVVIDKGGFLKAVEDSEIKDITVMEGFKVDGDVTINSAKTITIAKGETVSISSLTVNAPLTLNGQDPDVIAAAGALKMAASIGGGTQYGILRVSYGLTVSTASTLELTGEINLLFTAAVMMDDIKVDGLLKVADEALVCKIQIGGEPGTVKLGGSGAVQFGDTEAAPAADTDIELQVVDEPENDLGGGYFDEEEEEDEEEAFNDAIVSSLTLKLDSSGALSNLETDESGKVLKLAVNGTAKLAADITYTSGTAAKVTWLSKSPGAVSVDDNGNVKVISGGSVQITAYAGGKSDTCTVSSAKGAGLYVGDDLIDLSNKTESSMLEKAFSYIKSDNTTANEYTIVLDTNEEDNTGDGYTIGSGAG